MRNNKLAITAAIVLAIVVVSAIGIYYSALATNNKSPSDGSSGSSTQTLDNLRVGDYANYTVKEYENDAVTTEYPVTWMVDEGTYNGADCLVMTITADTTATSKTIIYWYMDKETYQGLTMKTQVYVDDALISENESEFTQAAAYIDPQTIVGQETVTVSAGTFTCDKVVVSDATTSSTTTQWYSTDVPIVGLVKLETYEANQLSTTRELIDYSR